MANSSAGDSEVVITRTSRIEEIAVLKALVPQDAFAGAHGDGLQQQGSCVHTSVKLTPLPAGVHVCRKLAQQLRVELPAREPRVELGRIHASENRVISASN